MAGHIIEVRDDVATIQVSVKLIKNMLDAEEAIQEALNEGGRLLTAEALKYFDTDGSAIRIGATLWHTKGQIAKTYQAPYGEVRVARHVYQKAGGGKTYCPMEEKARLIMNTTPLFSRQVSSKFARNAPRDVQRDLQDNHGRMVSVSFLQNLSNTIAAIAQAREEEWSYHVPELDAPVATIGISLDGTCMLMCESGWREAMAASLSLYDRQGERLHSIYLGAAPEYGKGAFLRRLTRETELLKARYPHADYIGIADGAKSNWLYLAEHTATQILDYYHASGYLGAVAKARHPGDIALQKQWLADNCHQLKHEDGAAEKLYHEMCRIASQARTLPKKIRKGLSDAVTYFKNNRRRMMYADYRSKGYPIGSGVVEAACKRLIKQRLCLSGMRWKEPGAAAALSLRALVLTKSRWQQFWDKFSQYGIPVAQNT